MRPGSSLAALVALAAALPACATTAPTAARRATDPAADDARLRGPLLWEVAGADGPSYLFGTIHAGFRPDTELPQLVWDKLAAADGFAMEADITAVSPIELMKRAALPAGQTLDDQLGEQDWARLQVLVGSGMAAGSLKLLAPWFVYSLILQTLYPTPHPLDLALQERAAALGKQMTYLEDWQFQLGMLADLMGLDDLRDLLADDGTARAQLDTLIAAYRAGDFARLSAIVLDPVEAAAHPERMRRMFDDRNRAWLATLVPRLRRGKLFVAVGVGHFAGAAGLLALLRAEGFTVRRVALATGRPAGPK